MRVPSTPVQIIRNAYASTNVTTSAYVQLDSAINEHVSMLEIYDSSGQSLVLALGPASGEVDMLYVVPGGNGKIPVQISKGTRLSIKAVSANATSGELLINCFG